MWGADARLAAIRHSILVIIVSKLSFRNLQTGVMIEKPRTIPSASKSATVGNTRHNHAPGRKQLVACGENSVHHKRIFLFITRNKNDLLRVIVIWFRRRRPWFYYQTRFACCASHSLSLFLTGLNLAARSYEFEWFKPEVHTYWDGRPFTQPTTTRSV